MKNNFTNDRVLRADEYASVKDFCAIFRQDVRSLYLLALMLTGSEAKAGTCFVGAFEECQASTRVFKPWANAWSKLRVIDKAVQAVDPRAGKGADRRGQPGDVCELPEELASVLKLEGFQRFVYVLTVLEKYSLRDAAILLKHNVGEVARAQRQAIESLGSKALTGAAFLAEHAPASISA